MRLRQLEQLTALEEVLDAGTVRHLEALGVDEGWRCLEAGAGGGSIARWLSERVGRDGHVLAIDLDTRFAEGALLHQRNSAVVQCDLLQADLPEAVFDLVHARCVLAWLPRPSHAIARLVDSLRPDGWLVAEEMDFISMADNSRLEAALSARLTHMIGAFKSVLERGRLFDATFGRRLPAELEAAGLARVRAEGRVGIWRGGGAGGRLWRSTLDQYREVLTNSGLVNQEDIDSVIGLCDEPCLQLMSPVTMAAWGRRPSLPGRKDAVNHV